MDIKYFKAGKYVQQFQYKSFLPELINKEWLISDPSVNSLLAEANLKLGELNAFSSIVPDVNLFIRMHIVKEATTSSRIEGTRTNIDEAMLKERDVDPERKDDWIEVQNYISAMNSAVEKLSQLPISTRLIKQIHRTLMENSRGENKLPGEFRSSQNWIGGASIMDATFIPPQHTEINPLLSDLENFINNEVISVPHLIKIAIIHYQFETIHPFLDGNGRVGRLLITLYLVANNLLSKPTLYLSDFFENNRQLYYDNLSIARVNNNLTQWIKFFLSGVISTADNGIYSFKQILKLRKEIEENKIAALGKKIKLAKLTLNYLYSNPIIYSNYLTEELNITKPTAYALINDFCNLGILKEVTGRKRNKLYVFQEYLNIFVQKRANN